MVPDATQQHELFISFRILDEAAFTLNLNGITWMSSDELPPPLKAGAQPSGENEEAQPGRLLEFELEILGSDIIIELEAAAYSINGLLLKIDRITFIPLITTGETITRYSWRIQYESRPSIIVGGSDLLIDEKRKKEVTGKFSAQQEDTFYSVDVFYATNRQKNPTHYFGNESEVDNKLNYGVCKVNIPENRYVGEIPRPKWWLLQFTENRARFMDILNVDPLEGPEFFRQVKVKAFNAAENDVLVFIHGFNVNFEDAVLRAAQISVDLAFAGAPVVFSWPSQGKVRDYIADGNSVEYSIPFLIQFLKDLKKETGPEGKIHIIAHSMGNRALVRALVQLQNEISFNQVILAAPDIDARDFVYNISPNIRNGSERITLYASRRDKALRLSAHLNYCVRAGDCSEKVICVPGIDTVDASEVNTNLLAHDYFCSTYALINDLYHLIKNGLAPSQRNLDPITANGLSYWKLRKN